MWSARKLSTPNRMMFLDRDDIRKALLQRAALSRSVELFGYFTGEKSVARMYTDSTLSTSFPFFSESLRADIQSESLPNSAQDFAASSFDLWTMRYTSVSSAPRL